MYEINIKTIKNTQQLLTKQIKSPSEKNGKFNPNNNTSPNIFKNNLNFRINNYYLVEELEKNLIKLDV